MLLLVRRLAKRQRKPRRANLAPSDLGAERVWPQSGLTATPERHTAWLTDPAADRSWSLPHPEGGRRDLQYLNGRVVPGADRHIVRPDAAAR